MAILPRPVSPRALWADLRAFWATRSRHQWIAAVLALVIPAVIVTGFYYDAKTNILPGESIMFVDSWPANRTDAQIRAKQKADAAALAAARRARQREFQELDQSLNRLGL
jgi:hypothetical protein